MDDGIYVLLQPLCVGKHTLQFKGTFPEYGFTLDFTYLLTVGFREPRYPLQAVALGTLADLTEKVRRKEERRPVT